MRKHLSLSLANEGANDKLKRGKLEIEKGKKMVGLRLKVTIPINNVSGGAVVLSDAQKQTLLGLFTASINYGKSGSHKPFQAVTWARIHREQRYAYGSEMEGYTDTSTGLQRSLPNAATTNVTFYLIIPTGRMWMIRDMINLWGMGRSQCATVEAEVKRTGTTILASVTISGTTSIDVIPDVKSCKGDPWSWVPEYLEHDEAGKFANLPDGFPLRLSERTAVHASSASTSVDVDVDAEKIHQQVSAAELITEYNDDPILPAAASLTDRETLFYVLDTLARFKDLPSGKVKFTQNVKDIATALLSLLYCAVKTEEEVRSEVENVASNIRGKTIRAVNLAHYDKLDVPQRLMPFMPMVFVDQDDREFEQLPGWVAHPNAKAEITVPESLVARAKALHTAHKAAGETKAAAAVIKDLAAAVPGAAQSGRGFRANFSNVLNRIEGFFK